MATHKIRLDAAGVTPGTVEQMVVKLEQPTRIVGVELDEPEHFEVVKVIAGRTRVEGGQPMAIDIAPPNAFVTVLVKNKMTEGETRVCGGALLCEGERNVPEVKPAPSPQISVAPEASSATTAPVVTGTGSITLKTDVRGWPLGGSNEVWVLMGRSEAERLITLINGYPTSAGERPALLRRFHQALGMIR